MGRSKFPGKPSKSINRKRISVLQLEEATDEDNLSSAAQQANVNEKSNCDDDHQKGGGGSGGGGGGRRGGGGASGGAGVGNNPNAANASRGVNGNSSGSSSGGGSGGNGGGAGGGKTNSTTTTTAAASTDICSGAAAVANIDKEAADCDANNSNDSNSDNDDEEEGDGDDDDDEDNNEDEDNADDVHNANEARNKGNKEKNINNDNINNFACSSSSSNSNSSSANSTSTSSSNSSTKNFLHSNKKFKNLNVGKEVMLPSSSKEKLFNCDAPSTATCNGNVDEESKTETCSANVAADAVALEAKIAIVGGGGDGDAADNEVNNCDSEQAVRDAEKSPINNKLSEVSSSSNNNNATTDADTKSISATTTNETDNSTAATKLKKTVTFKNILETSDDKSAIKKFYNPDNRTPLVSIMKKESMNRAMMYSRSSECIVRPSRLTEILKNNSNIDKLNSLKFRSSSSSATAASVCSSSSSSSSTTSIFGPSLSRAFGAPDNDEDEQQDAVTFRVHDTLNNDVKDCKEAASATASDATEVDTHLEANHDEVDDDEDDDDDNDVDAQQQQIIVDKHFVLPKRSTRSSRVIKPNKRFLDDAVMCKKPNRKLYAKANKEVHNNYFGLGQHKINENDSVATTSNLGLGSILSNKEVALSKTTTSFTLKSSSSPFCAAFGAATSNTNKFVLRQPRLQFDSLAGGGLISASTALSKSLTQSLSSNHLVSAVSAAPSFSLGNASNLLNNTVLNNATNCFVCSTQIHSKNIQQARKYGVLACEVCRKFISKITKKSVAANASPTLKSLQLQCKSDGNCAIHPPSKAYLKNFKKIYKERCTACWLKRCIQEFQFPSGHKLRLSAILPTSALKQEIERTEVALKKEDTVVATTTTTTDLIASSNLFATTRLNQQNSTQSQQIKWKTTEATSSEGLKLNIKSNLLAENNTTFGSSPLLRPAILEKSMFLKNIMEQQQHQQEKQQQQQQQPSENQEDKNAKLDAVSDSNNVQKSQDKPPAEIVQKPTKLSKRREKLDKEKEKQKEANKDAKSAAANKQSITTATTNVVAANKTNDSKHVSSSPTGSASTTANAAITTNATLAGVTTATTTTTTTATAVSTADPPKRQRIALKGPRVKHVCRSASIVLGQPLAMFGEEEEELEQLSMPTEPLVATQKLCAKLEENHDDEIKETKIVIDENENCSSCTKPQVSDGELFADTKSVDFKIEATASNEQPPPVKTAKVEVLEESTKPSDKKCHELEQKSMPLQPLKATTRQTSNVNYTSSSLTTISKKHMRHEPLQQQLRRKEPQLKLKTMISIDFWENYDPAEVCQTGFGLIVTETVAQRALCFLCGSAGLDPLIFCACCCEPYHQYCVLDEYNLKHSSLDDTMVSLLDTSLAVAHTNNSLIDNFSLMTQRLNWLCPRCTICYTCNMSSGAKVRCQKCQKNYHSTCLGTSKRLLGADRPLICVNCLKCKSCSTTKVSKFVGNLPMCTTCFKLRKKGNYCPICQKCYDDNDFDLKMMECGNCKQWVHSKCEGLSDEQYNLLSTLPESTEFICKKCARRDSNAKQKAEELRQAVMEEFKTTLLSVLKLLSKSRQACALLKLSPRKKLRCTCGAQGTGGRMQPKCLQFMERERDNLGSDGESQCSEDIYEFKENSVVESEERRRGSDKCTCMNQSYYNQSQAVASEGSTAHLNLVDIKKKICSGNYVSLAEFNYDMNNIIQHAACDELIIAYKEILSEQFPWFQNETKACTDALEEDMFESCGAFGSQNSLDSHHDYQQQRDEEPQHADVIDLPEDIDDVIYSLKVRNDQRLCLFCRKIGEGLSNEESRLIYCGQDCWVHTNCAMWSAEVFEEIDGSLQNVHSAVSRGRMIKCTVCGTRGATVGCNVKSCGEHYHYPCARSIECAFLTDKTMYCPAHAHDALKANSASIETNFDVSRPVYVELDRKRKKLLEPSKVQFHIGSLEVKQLGTIFPKFSDTFEALIPINFLCSRLYWSLKEPWKVVEYTVRTTIQNNYSTYTSLDAEKHFTVDHTNSNASIMGLAQITRWHNSLAARCEFIDYAAMEPAALTTLSKLLPPEYFAQNQCSSSATDENTEEEPQTNADLLPPEIKDAIFEDLPHEILDGISMLDIFPKFMIYEDIVNMEGGGGKVETLFNNEQSKDGATNSTVATNINISDEDTVNSSAFSKQMELSNSWSSAGSNLPINHVEDAMLAASRQAKRSENSLQLLKKTANPPRTWAKLESNAIKRRKISKGLQDMRLTEGVLLSLNQTRAVKKESTTTTATVAAALTRRQSVSTESTTMARAPFTWSAAKRYPFEANTNKTSEDTTTKLKLMQVDGVDDSITEYRIITNNAQQMSGTVKCDRCHCTYRTYDSFQRHLATCEPLSTSESESETAPRSPDVAGGGTSPLVNEHDFNKLGGQRMTTTQLNGGTAANLPFIQAFPQSSIPIGNMQANINGIPINVQGLQNMQGLQQLQGLQNIQIQNLQPQSLGGNFFISQATPNSNANSDEMHYFGNSLQGLTANLGGNGYTLTPTNTTNGFGGHTNSMQQPQLIAVSTNPDGTQQIIQIPTTTQQQQQQQHNVNAFQQALQQAAAAAANNNDKKMLLKSQKHIAAANNKTMQQQQQQNAGAKQKFKCNSIKPIQSKVAPCSTVTQQQLHTQQQQPITVFSAPGTTNTQLLNQNLLQQMQVAQQQQQQQPQIIFQTTNNAGQQQPIIMQQLGTNNNTLPSSQNIISFISNDGAHHQQPQVQYVSIPTVGNNSNQLMQGAFLQTDASGNLVLTTAAQQPSAMQMLSATQLNQPQVIGTIIQPQTLQLGSNVITTTDPTTQQQQQLIIGNTATGLEMITASNASAPQVILTTQPMYYGLETIVQNTVMSSQQFVSTAMPGVLSQNASFSATTTQVFQASKIEPIVDMPTTSYVVLNNVDAGSSMTAQQPSYLNAANVLQQQQQHQQQQQANLQQQHQMQNMQAADVQQQQNLMENLQQQHQQPTVYRLQTQTNNAATPVQLYQTQQPQQQNSHFSEPANQQQQQQIITAKIPPVAQSKRNNAATKAMSMATVTKVQPQVVNKVMPTTAAAATQPQKSQPSQQLNQNKTSLSMQRNNGKPLTLDTNVAVTTVTAEMLQQVFSAASTTTTATTTVTTNATNQLQSVARKQPNVIRPINKAEIKPKVIKTATATATSKQQQQQYTQQQQQPQQQQQDLQMQAQIKIIDYVDDMMTKQQQTQDAAQHYVANNTTNYNGNVHNNCYAQEQQQEFIAELTSATDTNDTLYQLQQDMVSIMPTTSTCSSNSNSNSRLQYATTTLNSNNAFNNNNVPTNIVNPIQQQMQYNAAASQQQSNATSYVSRPTNRVLPMQQRQDNIGAAGVNKTTTQATVTSKVTQQQSNNVAKCYETGNSSKNAYESEIKKEEQQLLQHELQMLVAQSESNAAYEKIMLQQQEEIAANSPKSVSGDDEMEVMEAEAAALTCQQLEIVADNLENLAASIMCAEKEHQQQEQQQHLQNTTCQALADIVAAAAAENDMNEHEIDAAAADGANGDNDDVEDDEEEDGADDDEDEDDDDDDFSLKMPTDDADQELSDSDEPAVKEKISKILDNLTNEDCTEALRTTATVEETNISEVTYMPMAMEQDVQLLTEENQNNYQSPSYEHQLAAQENISNFQYTTASPQCMEVQMTPEMDQQQSPTAATVQSSESSLYMDALKIGSQVTLDCSTTTTIATAVAPISSSTAETAVINQVQTAYKTTPPQHPARDPQKITGPHLLYEIQSEDGFTYKSTSITEIWEKVFEAVQVARRAHGLAPLPEGPLADMSGVQMIGLKTNALKYLIEQLPGVEKCSRYTPKYHKRSATTTAGNSTSAGGAPTAGTSVTNLAAAAAIHIDAATALLDYCSDQDELLENPYESARCEPYSKRSDYDMFSWLASRHRKQPIQVFVQPSDTELIPRRGTGSNLPMAMKYRTLKETYKDYVGVFRSHIHGRGLYCTKDIEAGEMVIEYAGELIRSTLTDKRERNYDSRGIGCYMFKIDENLVVDATMRGNAARFINHSCEPNCYSKVVDILGHKHIIIFALRRIVQGEELTYDYKFPFEDEKIPCSCGSKKCRKYLN